MNDHTQRLTIVNRKLVLELNDIRSFVRRLINPEDLGLAVSEEVRREAKRVLDTGEKND